MQRVEIEGNDFACIHVTKDDLSRAIRYDIEVMFWRAELSNYTVKEKRNVAIYR